MTLLKRILILLTLVFPFTLKAAPGLLFNLTHPAASQILTNSPPMASLCLNGKGAISCQSFEITSYRVIIATTIPHHTYPIAGIKLLSTRYSLGNIGLDCTMQPNGYCTFSVSDTSPKSLRIVSSNGIVISPVSYSTLPILSAGTDYALNFSVLQGVPPYTLSFSLTPETSGTPIPTCSMTNLNTPNGYFTGHLSCTATDSNVGYFKLNVTAVDSNYPTPSTKTNTYVLQVVGSVVLNPTTNPLATYAQNVEITQAQGATIYATGGNGTYTYSITSGSLPPGMTSVTSNNQFIIYGTPTTTGRYEFQVTATDGLGNKGVQNYIILITGTLVINYQGTLTNSNYLPNATLNPPGGGVNSYSATFFATNGVAPYKYVVSSGTIPNNMSFNSQTGILSGDPDVASTYNFTITAEDSLGNTGSFTYNLIVTGTLVLSPPNGSLPSVTTNQSYNTILSPSYIYVTNTANPIQSYTLAGGSFPTGMSVGFLTGSTTQGNITGSTTQTGTYVFNIEAIDKDNDDPSDPIYNTGIANYGMNVTNTNFTFTPVSNTNTGISQNQHFTFSGTVNCSTGCTISRITSTSLPSGVNFTWTPSTSAGQNGTFTISGTYSGTTNFYATVTAFDSFNNSSAAVYFFTPYYTLIFNPNSASYAVGKNDDNYYNVQVLNGNYPITVNVSGSYGQTSSNCRVRFYPLKNSGDNIYSSSNPIYLSGSQNYFTIQLHNGSHKSVCHMSVTFSAGDSSSRTGNSGTFTLCYRNQYQNGC
jgi:hypothetical protein